MPVEQVSAEIAAAYMKDANAKTEELLLDHQWMCDVHKVYLAPESNAGFH